MMICAISKETPQHPVVSIRSGIIFEKRLLEKWLEDNENKCPITGEVLSPEEIIEIKTPKSVIPRPITATSIPGLLSLFQNEWDALMLETFQLKQQLDTVRKELAHSLYQHDAACRVIARLVSERDEARNMLANLKAQGGVPKTSQDSADQAMDVENQPGISKDIIEKIKAKSMELSSARKKRQISESLAQAEKIKEYEVTQSHSLHKNPPGISAVDVHPTDQNQIVTGGQDASVIVFNRNTKKATRVLKGHSDKITQVQFHPSKDIILSSSSDNTAIIWGDKQEPLHVVKVHSGEVTSISLHATGEYWTTTSRDKSWGFHDIETGTCLKQITSDSVLESSHFHPDGLLLGTGTKLGVVKIWDIKTQKDVVNFAEHKDQVTDLCFSENGFYLATGSADSTVKLWDLRKQQCFHTIDLEKNPANCVEFDYSGTYLAVGAGNSIRVYMGKTFTHVSNFNQHTDLVTDVKWGADAQFLASTSLDKSMKIWQKKEQKPKKRKT